MYYSRPLNPKVGENSLQFSVKVRRKYLLWEYEQVKSFSGQYMQIF